MDILTVSRLISFQTQGVRPSTFTKLPTDRAGADPFTDATSKDGDGPKDRLEMPSPSESSFPISTSPTRICSKGRDCSQLQTGRQSTAKVVLKESSDMTQNLQRELNRFPRKRSSCSDA